KCENCPLLEKCTSSRKHQKTISAHIWQEYLDECEKTRHSDKWKRLYPRRKQTIERAFGDCKENHCLRYTRIRGLRKNSHQAAIIYSCLNLKKLSLWRSRNTYLYDLMDKTGKTKQEILESCSKA
ncbi:MAG: transposase, partial [Erysipelotrichaceae bacterium]|nr:transposase [Erysipelotrichaceae bacterium]